MAELRMAGLAWRAILDLVDDPPWPNRIKPHARGELAIWEDPSPERVARITACAADALLWSIEWRNCPTRDRTRTALKRWLARHG